MKGQLTARVATGRGSSCVKKFRHARITRFDSFQSIGHRPKPFHDFISVIPFNR